MYKCFPILLVMVFFIGSINTIVVQCKYEFDYFYFCHGTVIDGYKNPNITEVQGDHVGNRTLADVDSVRLIKQNLTEFPGHIEKFFPKVSKIDLAENNLTNITNAEIRNIPKLRDLVLWGNKLTILDGNLLQGMCYIKFLDLDYNQIKHVGDDFQFPENALLFMQHNSCINITIFGVLEVLRIKSIFRSKCPPVGVEPTVLNENDIVIPEYVRRNVEAQAMYSRMQLFEERLEALEAKMANAVEIRISDTGL
ncbi:leucine-rich repeat transmembrane neuronal protein 1-like [Bradysia coprophila]|uniref:leucine-rich repeat transmembrane neuronal protein 1-like n=1 Tax=Bradysia coprophila TaxID=38358 RepID=UPI00187DBE51|nr:leucine-rich repeat transmembrane neuronal protein 1-like [Bradysia coprophila]